MAALADRVVFVETDILTWSDADYQRLLAELDSIFQAKRDTPEGARLDMLATLIEAYEEKRFSISEWAAGGKMTNNAEPSASQARIAV
jgi:hypothetical protein